MNETKRCFVTLSLYDAQAIETKLEKMAAEGWMVEKLGSFLWSFKRVPPQTLRFSVTYFSQYSQFDSDITEKEQTKIDFCAEDGWVLAARSNGMQIFYNEQLDAVPIETDPVTQVKNVYQAVKKGKIWPGVCPLVLSCYYLLSQFFRLQDDPADYLSDPVMLYMIPMWFLLLLIAIKSIVPGLCWYKRAKRAAERDGVFLPIKHSCKGDMLALLLAAIIMVLAISTKKGMLLFMILWIGVLAAIFWITSRLLKRLQKKGLSRTVNQVVYLGLVVVLSMGSVFAIGAMVLSGTISMQGEGKPVGSYEVDGRTWEIYDDPLPLEIEDLTEASGKWSKESQTQETMLLAKTEYQQRPLLTEEKDLPALEYTVIDVKQPGLQQMVEKAILQSHKDEHYGDAVFYDSFFPVDALIWQAQEAYQLKWSDSQIMNHYLVFWEGRIVEITYSWEPTPEQIGITAEKLGKKGPAS